MKWRHYKAGVGLRGGCTPRVLFIIELIDTIKDDEKPPLAISGLADAVREEGREARNHLVRVSWDLHVNLESLCELVVESPYDMFHVL